MSERPEFCVEVAAMDSGPLPLMGPYRDEQPNWFLATLAERNFMLSQVGPLELYDTFISEPKPEPAPTGSWSVCRARFVPAVIKVRQSKFYSLYEIWADVQRNTPVGVSARHIPGVTVDAFYDEQVAEAIEWLLYEDGIHNRGVLW